METSKEAGKVIYNVATKVISASGDIEGSEEIYRIGMRNLADSLKAYGGISKLEDKFGVFASKLRESEENLKNDLGGRSFFKKEMDIRKYLDVEALEEFGDFEKAVGTNYASRFIGDVYAKLDKKGDVLVNYKKRVDVGGRILSAIPGATGIIAGAVLCAIPERLVTGLPVELDSPFVVAGAIVGWVGMSSLMYDIFKESCTFINPLSKGADDLEKRVGVVRKALNCRCE